MPVNQTTCEVWAPAKLNLYLEVVGRRDDGYHDLESLMTPIGIYDTLRFRVTQEPEIRLQWRATAEHTWSNEPSHAPASDANLVVRAVNAVRAAGAVKWGAAIQLVKRIPVGAGLGGGSSDAAAALLAAQYAWGTRLARQDLSRLALELGSDVPFFLEPVTGLYADRGERLRFAISLPTLHFVVVAPREANPTAEVFARYRYEEPVGSLSYREFPLSESDSRRVSDRQVTSMLFNRLQQPASALNPSVEQALSSLRESGLRHCSMTGSGSACFGVSCSRRQVNRVAALLRSRSSAQVFVATNCRIPTKRVVDVSAGGVQGWK